MMGFFVLGNVLLVLFIDLMIIDLPDRVLKDLIPNFYVL